MRSVLLHGADRVVEFARIDLGQVLFVFTLYKILLAIGYDLVFDDIPWAETIKVTVLRFVIMFIMRTILVMLLGVLFPQAGLTDAVNLMFLLPPPFVLPVFADDEDQRTYVSSALSLSTLASIIGFGVLAVL